MMHKRVLAAAVALLALAGCDVATDVAGDVIAGEVRTRYLEQCAGIAEGAGVAAGRISAACECSADRFADDLQQSGELQVNRERIEEVLTICVQEQRASDGPAPAEV